MNITTSHPIRAIACTSLLACAHLCPAGTLQKEGVRVEYASTVDIESARTVLRDEIAARDKVVAVLDRPAPAWIVVHVDSSRKDGIPYSEGHSIYAPEQRVGWPRTAANGKPRDNLSLVHETTHVVDSGKLRNRFLTEGLAVYVEDQVGEVAYPNFGVDLHACTSELQADYGSPIAMLDSEQVREASDSGIARQFAYAQEGSFARWLIQMHGMPAFLRVLDAQPPEKVYAASFVALEAEWRKMLATQVTGMAGKCALRP